MSLERKSSCRMFLKRTIPVGPPTYISLSDLRRKYSLRVLLTRLDECEQG